MFLCEVEFFFFPQESPCVTMVIVLRLIYHLAVNDTYIYLQLRVLVRFTLRVIFEKPFKIAGAFRRVEFERIFKYVS